MDNQKEEQFLRAYDEYADVIFRHCYFRISSRERAKDLMQETFIRAWEYVAKKGEVRNMRAFLYRIANNLVVDEYRKKKTLSLDELKEKGFDPSIEEEGKIHSLIEAKDALYMLDKIEGPYREVLIMRYIDDLSPKEIAAVLGESENAVSVRIHRGLKKIRTLMS